MTSLNWAQQSGHEIGRSTDTDCEALNRKIKEENFYQIRLERPHSDGELLVARENGEPIGLASGMDDYWVAPSKRGQGIGSALYEHYERKARKKRLSVLYADAATKEGRQLLEKNGFRDLPEDVQQYRSMPRLYKVLSKKLRCPKKASVPVRFELFTRRSWYDDEQDKPVAVVEMLGAERNAKLALPQRFISWAPQLGSYERGRLKISVNGKQLHDGDPDAAGHLGAVRDPDGHWFFDYVVSPGEMTT